MTLFALVDCNNFFASCERVFKPALENRPLVVLSNNDGCIIARSNEAKALGIPMGAPFFQWQAFCRQHRVHVFSANFELYGDMSSRVMRILEQFCPDLEIYSIDEAFLSFADAEVAAIETYANHLRHIIKTWTGIPVSIGIGPTKTLAKLASDLAKKQPTGVFNIVGSALQDRVLAEFPVEKLWGIGRRLALKLADLGIKTARDLRDADISMMRRRFTVVMEKMLRELRGTSCLPLEMVVPKQQIMSSRSFGRPVSTLVELEEAVSHYVARACIKLRAQKSRAGGVYVYLRTKVQGNQFSQSVFFPDPTSDTGMIIQHAKQCLRKIFAAGQRYHKAGIILLDLSPAEVVQFSFINNNNMQKSDSLMQVIDDINKVTGKNALFFAAEGIQRPWQVKCERRTPRYTTRWQELVCVR